MIMCYGYNMNFYEEFIRDTPVIVWDMGGRNRIPSMLKSSSITGRVNPVIDVHHEDYNHEDSETR